MIESPGKEVEPGEWEIRQAYWDGTNDIGYDVPVNRSLRLRLRRIGCYFGRHRWWVNVISDSDGTRLGQRWCAACGKVAKDRQAGVS